MIYKTGRLFLLSLFFAGTCQAIEPVFNGPNGVLEQVFSPNCLTCHSSKLVGAARNGAPFSVDFDIFERAKMNGDLIIKESVDLPRMPPKFSGIPLLNEAQKAALLAWQDAGFPEFSTQAVFDFTHGILTLPVVLVGETVFQASLQLEQLTSSPLGFGFKLLSASLSDVSLDNPDTLQNAAVFDGVTGVVTLPRVKLSNGAEGNVSAEMSLITGSNPLFFSLDSVQTIIE